MEFLIVKIPVRMKFSSIPSEITTLPIIKIDNTDSKKMVSFSDFIIFK